MKILKPLDPNDSFERELLKAEKLRQEKPLEFYTKVRDILREAKINALAEIGIYEDMPLDNNIIIATLHADKKKPEVDEIIIMRADLLPMTAEENLWHIDKMT